MLGLFIGAACFYGLVRVLRGGGCGGYSGYGYGTCGPGNERFRRGGPRRRGWFFLRGLFERLDTSPGQEKEIRAAVDEVLAAGEALKEELSASRADLARAFRRDTFDEDLAGELLGRHDEKLNALRHALVGALARVHATLEPAQRDDLARWLGRGPRPWGGPYRSWA